MSSNGPIPPNMNSAPLGASAYEPEQTGVRHSLHHCYIWLGALRAAPVIFICGFSSLPGLTKLAEALGFISVNAFFAAVLLLLAFTVLICGMVMGPVHGRTVTPGTNLTKRNSASTRGS